MRRHSASAEFVDRVLADWDEMVVMENARTETVRERMLRATTQRTDTEYQSDAARAETLGLVSCGHCALAAPQDTTIAVLALGQEFERSQFFCCRDCLGRWAAASANLALVADKERTDSYYAIIDLLSQHDLTREELGGIASACRRQVKALGG